MSRHHEYRPLVLGHVDMHLTPDADLSYAIGLIRQAYESQMEAIGA